MIIKNTSNHITFERNLTDLIKFLSCLMIALHHYSQGMVVAGTHNPFYHLFSTQGGWLGVAIFFFLSGYGLMKSDMKHHLSPVHFFQKRLLKTYFPAVLVSILWSVYHVFWMEDNISWKLIIDVFWNFNDEVLWFVRAIVKLYVAFYAYSYLRTRMPKFKIFAFLMIASISIWWVNAGFVHGASVLLFFVGMSLAEYDEWWLRMIRKIYPVVLVFVTIFTIAFVCRHDASWIHLLINYFVILIGIFFVATYNISLPSLPKWIGGASYDVYLVHNKVLMLLRTVYSSVPLWMYVLVTLVFTLIFYNLKKLIKL